LNARNISIALSKPQDISVLNVLPGVIESIEKIDTSTVDVTIRLATQLTIDARITTLAHQNLNLAIGTSVFALIKSVAVDRF
jgi:molybdate transport system ATP-binding protein